MRSQVYYYPRFGAANPNAMNNLNWKYVVEGEGGPLSNPAMPASAAKSAVRETGSGKTAGAQVHIGTGT